jgi:NADH-quinone oxidoreductase subunit M
MATNTSEPMKINSVETGRDAPAWVVPLFLALGALIVIVLSTQLLGATGKEPISFSPANATIGAALPFLLAATIAAFVPRGHGWQVRLPIALVTGLFALFVARMWPASTLTLDDVAEAPKESETLLTWLIGLPLAGAVAILFLPRQAPRVLKTTTMLVMFGTFAASLPLLSTTMGSGFHFNHDVVWVERFGIHYHVALDGVSLWLVLLSTFVMPIAAYSSFGSINTRIKDWCFSLLLLEAAMIGAFVALDLFLFYVFWEMLLIPMYVMIGVWGGSNRIRASLKFFIYTMFGSLLMLAAILYTAYTYGKITGTPSFDFFELQRVVYPQRIGTYLFWGFAASFLIKVPMFPVHTWLPDAHTEAPTAGSVILAAVLLKMGTYGYLRFCMGLFPEVSADWAATLAGVAVLGGILYGALCAWRQDDVKRLVAYSSVAHLGYVMLGLFSQTQSGIEGAILQMINHGLSTGLLFLLVGVVYDRRHTRMLDDFGGLAKPMPIYAALFVIASMASVGLPGTNGFIGEFMIIIGTFTSTKLGHVNGIQAVGAAIGVILAALYMLTAVQKMFFGPITRAENKHLPDINGRELVVVAPLLLGIFTIGLAPRLLLEPMHDAVARVQTDMNARVDAYKNYAGPIKLVPRRPDAPKPVALPAQNAAPNP